MRFIVAILLAWFFLLQAGCILNDIAHEVQVSMQRCSVESVPPGATVYLNGRAVGKTPCEIGRPVGNYGRSDYQFAVQKLGYHTATQEYNRFPTYARFDLQPDARAHQAADEALVEDCDLGPLPAGAVRPSLAVLDFQLSGEPAPVGVALADFCREAIQDTGRFILVDREHMRTILSEEDFAKTFTCDDTRCLVDFGRKLQAQKVIHGRSTSVGQTHVLTLKIIDVATAEIEAIRNTKVVGAVESLLDRTPETTCELLRAALDRGDEGEQAVVDRGP